MHWTISDTGWAQAAWTNVFAPWRQGAAVFIRDLRGRFDPVDTLEMLARYPVTTFFAPPTAYRLLVQQPLARYQFQALRHTTGAGEPVNPELVSAWREGTGHTIYECYGQTETVLLTRYSHASRSDPDPWGSRRPATSSRSSTKRATLCLMARRATSPSACDRIGQWACSVGIGRTRASTDSQRGDWYITFDRAIRDERGYYWFVDELTT